MATYVGTDAWILGAREAGEADKIVFIYTKELGHIDALAKGVRQASSKLKGHLNTFSKVRALLARGKEFWRLLDAEALALPEGQRKLKSAEECRDFFLRVVTHTLPDVEIWNALDVLSGVDGKSSVLDFKARVLVALGILPEHGGAYTEEEIEQVLAANHVI